MQRYIPFGYQICNGKAEIQTEWAERIRAIFQDYLNGMSTNQIAKNLTQKGVLNGNEKPSWNHGSIGNILENTKYLGDEFYPPLIEKRLFEEVQIRRQQQAKKLGRIRQPSDRTEQSIWKHLLVCGECGHLYRKEQKKGKKPKWKCKHANKQKKAHSQNDWYEEQELERAWIQMMEELVKQPKYVKSEYGKKPIPKSWEEQKLTEQIERCFIEPTCDVQTIKQLAFLRAEKQYQTIQLDDRRYQNERLKELIKQLPRPITFNASLVEQIVTKVLVQKENGLEFHLKNGHRIFIQRKEMG